MIQKSKNDRDTELQSQLMLEQPQGSVVVAEIQPGQAMELPGKIEPASSLPGLCDQLGPFKESLKVSGGGGLNI